MQDRQCIVVDPILATGYSALAAVQILTCRDIAPEHIKLMVLVAAPKGMQVFSQSFPQINVYCAALDKKLNANAYILPGLGDAGDRLLGTQ